MRRLFQLTEDDFIAMAKLIDNNFTGNAKICVTTKVGVTRVFGHTDGKQCINCDVEFKIKNGVEFIGAYIQDVSEDSISPYREVMPVTLKKIIHYLQCNKYLIH